MRKNTGEYNGEWDIRKKGAFFDRAFFAVVRVVHQECTLSVLREYGRRA